MTTQANIPAKWYVPFANGDGSRVELPVTTADPTRASQTLGFPPLTMQPPESGGVPPQGEDFNGGMNQVARVCWWVLNGGGWPYDASFATQANILGYPNGATLQAADFRGDWINTSDNNQNNPDTSGTGWVPGFQYGVTALAGLTGGTVTPTPAQAAKNSITLAGTLGSALTIVLPTWLKNWTITNNTTGAFVTIVKTAAGAGVTIPQTGQPTRVTGDGTNILQLAENVATATQPNNPIQLTQVQQTYAWNHGFQTVSATGSFVVPANVYFLRYRMWAGGGGSGGTGAAGQSAGGGGGGEFAEGVIAVTPALSVSCTIGAAGAAGGGGGSGGAGGTTSFTASATTITVVGGSGGSPGVGGSGGGGGTGGTGAAGRRINGGSGGSGNGSSGTGGVGGSAGGGGGSGSGGALGATSAGATPGGGGGGPGSAGGVAGAAGGAGQIVFEW